MSSDKVQKKMFWFNTNVFPPAKAVLPAAVDRLTAQRATPCRWEHLVQTSPAAGSPVAKPPREEGRETGDFPRISKAWPGTNFQPGLCNYLLPHF